MTKVQHNILEPLEKILTTAMKANYARISPSEWKMISDMYKELFGTALSKSQENCSRCRLTAIKRVAAEYFNYKPVGRKSGSGTKMEPNKPQQGKAE